MTTKAEKEAKAQVDKDAEAAESVAQEDAVQAVLTDDQINEMSVEQIDALIKSIKARRRGAGKSEAEAEYKTLVDGAIVDLLDAIESVSGKMVGTLDLRVRLDRETGEYVATKTVVRISNMDIPESDESKDGESGDSEDGESGDKSDE